MKKYKSALALGGVLLLFLIGISGCFEKPKHYPHYLTAFVEPDTFLLEGNPIVYTSGKESLCNINLFNKKKREIHHFSYSGDDTRIETFLAAIGDTHYHDRNYYERRARLATGVIVAPKRLVVTCDRDYNETLKAGENLNEVISIFFVDHLSFIQSGYKKQNDGANISLKNQKDLEQLLASDPRWDLVLEKHPDAWNGETVRFTVTMVLPTDKGDKSVTNSIDVRFPMQSQTPMQ